MMRHLVRGALAALALLASCREPTAVIRDLHGAERRWAATAPDAYEVTVGRSCFCGPAVTRSVVVRVRGGQVESRRYLDTGADVPADIAVAYPTVDALFAIIDDAEARGAAVVDARYDDAYGFPVSVYLDYSERIADEEQSYSMTNLHPIP